MDEIETALERRTGLDQSFPRYHSRFETVMEPQLENSGDRYGLCESVLFAVLVLLRLLANLLMVRMSSGSRTQGSH